MPGSCWSNHPRLFCIGIEGGSGYAIESATLLTLNRASEPAPQNLQQHPRLLAQVFTVNFWMALLGAATCKPTKMMGNIPTINGLDRGKLSNETRKKKLKNKTTRSFSKWFMFTLANKANMTRQLSQVV